MNVRYLRIWKNFDVTMAALNAANARHYGQTEPMRPEGVSAPRWRGMIRYFFTRANEEWDG